MSRTEPTAEYVRLLFTYSPDDGYLRWRISRRNGVKVGDVAGHLRVDGYWGVYLSFEGNRNQWLAHRLIWLWVHGEMPSATIDHVNLDKVDNRLVNLRLATMAENKANVRVRADSTSGLKGVTPFKGRWMARIGKNGSRKFLGFFGTAAEAHAAYRNAAFSAHGAFARTT